MIVGWVAWLVGRSVPLRLPGGCGMEVELPMLVLSVLCELLGCCPRALVRAR